MGEIIRGRKFVMIAHQLLGLGKKKTAHSILCFLYIHLNGDQTIIFEIKLVHANFEIKLFYKPKKHRSVTSDKFIISQDKNTVITLSCQNYILLEDIVLDNMTRVTYNKISLYIIFTVY